MRPGSSPVQASDTAYDSFSSPSCAVGARDPASDIPSMTSDSTGPCTVLRTVTRRSAPPATLMTSSWDSIGRHAPSRR